MPPHCLSRAWVIPAQRQTADTSGTAIIVRIFSPELVLCLQKGRLSPAKVSRRMGDRFWLHRGVDHHPLEIAARQRSICEAYLSVQKFPAGDEVAEGQTVDAQELGNDGLGNALLKILPDEILFSGEFGFLGQAAFGSA